MDQINLTMPAKKVTIARERSNTPTEATTLLLNRSMNFPSSPTCTESRPWPWLWAKRAMGRKERSMRERSLRGDFMKRSIAKKINYLHL
jgi:hypothetical protein